ncbi:MAG: pyrimidine dimer DNA glycosylase/endonuclease V [Candidatus Nanoarchaeia archaeon]|nr:pyrimidine dimer DNA glycosylase/endonuclease V [Candidatus Nanoarchaeia archaeon]
MRIWSIHPKYLDAKRLTAVWRETLLAKAVLEGKTKSYKNHPQLIRFKLLKNPLVFINTYLYHIHQESMKRGYKFNIELFNKEFTETKIPVNDKQLIYEINHLKKKLDFPEHLRDIKLPEPNPIFVIKEGEIEDWEKVK